MKTIRYTTFLNRRPAPRHLCAGLGWLILAALAGLWGCQSDPADPVDDPSPQTVIFLFFPTERDVTVWVGEVQEFRVEYSGSDSPAAAWTLDGTAVGSGTSYIFTPQDSGDFTLELVVTKGDQIERKSWAIQARYPMPPVEGIAVVNGPAPGEVAVQWNPVPAGSGAEEATDYLVAVSYDGPINEQNWGSAHLLGTYPAGEALYREVFRPGEDEILPGAEAWFMVRAQGAAGGLSVIADIYRFDISFPWYIEGYSLDDANNPLGGIIISYRNGCPECRVNSDASGHFRIGPLFNTQTVDLQTISSDAEPVGEPFTSWYDRSYPTFGYSGFETLALDVELITRYGLACPQISGVPVYGDDFLAYLCWVTRNTPSDLDRRLFTWAQYPVAVYIPLFEGPSGFDLGLASRRTLIIWNTLLGEDYFILVDDPDLAQVVFRFPYYDPLDPDYDLGGSRIGFTKVTEPSGLVLGAGIPEAMRVSIEPTLSSEKLVKEVALHELGHVLGYADHSNCPSVRYLMDYSPAGALDYGEENAIHEDELRAVRAIRYLPQGVDLSLFEYEGL